MLVIITLSGLCLVEGKKSRAAWVFTILVGVGILSSFVRVTTVDSLASANALKLGNSGKNIVFAIISANYEREVKGQTEVWPSASADFSGELKDYTKVPDSETYFMDLMQLKSVENLSWHAFSGGGVGAASDSQAFSQGGFNVWNIIAGLDENASDETPFLFTRNLNITMDELRNEKVDLRSRLDPGIKPFEDLLVVVVTKGGAMRLLKKRHLTRGNFFGNSVFNTLTNRNATILKTKVLTSLGDHKLPGLYSIKSVLDFTRPSDEEFTQFDTFMATNAVRLAKVDAFTAKRDFDVAYSGNRAALVAGMGWDLAVANYMDWTSIYSAKAHFAAWRGDTVTVLDSLIRLDNIST